MAQPREVHALLLCPGESGDAVQTLVVAAQLHRRGILRLCAVIACGGPNRERGALVLKRVLRRLGVDVPVGVGSADASPLAWCEPPELALEDETPMHAADTLVDGRELLDRILNEAEPRSLTVVCTSAMSDLAAAISADPARAHRKLAELSIQGGLERAPDRRGWLPDAASNNLADVRAASYVYRFCLERSVPLAVVSRHAVPAVPLQLAHSFAARSTDPLPAYIAKAQHESLCALWQRVHARDGSLPARCDRGWFLDTFCAGASASARREAEDAGEGEAAERAAALLPLLAGATVRPYSLIALLAITPSFRLLMPESQRMVEGPHRLYLRARHTLDVAHVLKVLRDSYHEAIILAFEAASAERARAPARAAGAGGAGVVGALFGRLWPAASTAGGGGEDGTRVGNASHGLPPANRSVDPTRAERRLRDAGLARFVARAFGGGGAQPTSTLQAAAGGSEAGTEARTMTESIESWAGGSTGPREARFLCAEEATELALVRAHSDGAVAADADADADAYADADAAAPTRDESYDALDEDKAEGERAALSTARACTREASLVDLFDAALAQAAARQWRLSVPLLAAACALLAGSAYAQLAVQIKPGWESASESTALLRADAFAVAYLAAAIALMLALQPTRSFLPLVRVAAQALALLYGSALLVSTRTFALRFVNARGAQAELVAEAGADVRAHAALLAAAVGWEPLLVLPMLAGSFANITQALWRHGKDVGSLSYCLFLTVGVASCGEVCGVVAKRLLLGWLTGGRGATVVLATVVRTAVKESLSSLLLWPRFRSVAHGLLAGALTSIGVSTQPQAPLAPLLGFGSAAVPQPSDLLADARAALRPLRAGDGGAARGEVDEEGLCAVLGGAAGAFDEPPAGHHAPDGPDGADAQPLHFVVHSAGDAARDKAAALARWARDLERPPRLVIDRVPTGQSCASLDDKERQLALATASLGLCSRLVVVAGPAFADSLWAVALLHAWTCLGRSADDATLVLAVPAPNAAARAAGADAAAAAAAGRAVLESFDAFAVMYARADAEGAESAAASSCAQLTLAVELATASAYNECVRAFVPLVHAQLCLLERAADGTAEAAHERAAPPVEPAVLALGALSEAHAEARLAAFAAPPALRRSGSGSSGSSGSAADAEPTFISHLRLAGAAQALVAAFGLRHAVPTSGPFVPLPLKGGAVARAAAVRRELCRRLSSRSSEESPARESPAREPMQTTPAAMLAPLAPRRRFEEDWAQQPLLSRTLASQ